MISQQTSERLPGIFGQQGNIIFIQGVGLGGGDEGMKMKPL